MAVYSGLYSRRTSSAPPTPEVQTMYGPLLSVTCRVALCKPFASFPVAWAVGSQGCSERQFTSW